MGFYFELCPSGSEFRENRVPIVLSGLYVFSGIALLGMGVSALSILGQLHRDGGVWDRLLLWIIFATPGIYFIAGMRLFCIRKFVDATKRHIRIGYRFLSRECLVREIERENISRIEILNKLPTPNFAPKQHDDSDYFFKGYWQLCIVLKNDKHIAIDRNNYRGALRPHYEALLSWYQKSDTENGITH